MKKKLYCFESDWRKYAFPEQACGLADEERLAGKYTRVKLTEDVPLQAGGMPIWSDGREAIINTENEHTIIFGGTASKKTRTLILPLIATLSQAHESMVIMDIKGELSDGVSFPQVRAALDRNGYDCRCLNLRDLDADGLNLLEEPYTLYKNGEKDKAMRAVNDFVEARAAIYKGSKADPFWEKTAKTLLSAIIRMMFELCDDKEKINLLSLVNFVDMQGSDQMTSMCACLEDSTCQAAVMLKSIMSEPDKTRMSTVATMESMLADFITNEPLLRMLSTSTFDIHQLGQKPTVLFVVLPDETDTYASIASILLHHISAVLVQDAYSCGGSLPQRVNFVCDEFCNYHVPGMARAISAHRSRNIRWYMVCQGKEQLENVYPEDAGTILANCTNLYFLNSPEMGLLRYLSDRSGETTVTRSGSPRPVMTVEDLQGLQKGWTHTDVYYTSGNIHYVSKMPDISLYTDLLPMPESVNGIPKKEFKNPAVYTPKQMLRDIRLLKQCYQKIGSSGSYPQQYAAMVEKARWLYD